MPLHLQLIDTALALVPGPSRLVIGFSGGLDSTVLLHLAIQWQAAHPAVALAALHVNHQLQADADHWQQHCAQLCQHWQIPLLSEVVAVDRSQASLEQAAREARYGAFRRQLQPGDVLLLAHHRDDQIETLFQRLLRGSGPLGLGGMGVLSGQEGLTILRPLLEQDRQQLEQYARHHQLRWIDDPSNQDSTFERNFLRNEVLPLLRSRWPQLNQTVARSARLNRDAADLLDQLAELDGAGQVQAGQPLPLARLRPLAPGRAMNLLRYWIRLHGVTAPSEAQLQRVLADMLPAADDAQPELRWGQQQLRRFQHALYCVPLLPDPVSSPRPWQPGQCQHPLPVGVLLQQAGQGVAFSRQRLTQAPLTLQTRQGGERLKPVGRSTNSFKHWLQEYRVPPWWREHWPILYCGDQIAGLPGLLVCEGFQPADAADALWLDWQAPLLPQARRVESTGRIG